MENGGAIMGSLTGATLLVTMGQVYAQESPTEFGPADVDGAYVVSLSGYVQPDPTNPFQVFPLAGLLRYCADGVGNAEVSITQNLGGACIQQGAGPATYSVNTDGMGTAAATVTTTEVSAGCGLLSPPINIGDQATFQTQFAIDGSGDLHILATALEVPLAPDTSVSLPLLLTGKAVRQGACEVEGAQP